MKEYSFVSWSFLIEESGMGSLSVRSSGGSPEEKDDAYRPQPAPDSYGRTGRGTEFEVAA